MAALFRGRHVRTCGGSHKGRNSGGWHQEYYFSSDLCIQSSFIILILTSFSTWYQPLLQSFPAWKPMSFVTITYPSTCDHQTCNDCTFCCFYTSLHFLIRNLSFIPCTAEKTTVASYVCVGRLGMASATLSQIGVPSSNRQTRHENSSAPVVLEVLETTAIEGSASHEEHATGNDMREWTKAHGDAQRQREMRTCSQRNVAELAASTCTWHNREHDPIPRWTIRLRSRNAANWTPTLSPTLFRSF